MHKTIQPNLAINESKKTFKNPTTWLVTHRNLMLDSDKFLKSLKFGNQNQSCSHF
jgi:hypothetical protein